MKKNALFALLLLAATLLLAACPPPPPHRLRPRHPHHLPGIPHPTSAPLSAG